MNIAICDDNMIFASGVEKAILAMKIPDLQSEVFSSGETLLHALSSGNSYPVYFLDIEMGEVDGIETARRIRKNDRNAIIIFMTSHDEYVFQVFEVLPFRFLRKPFSDEEVQKVMRDCLLELDVSGRFFFFRNGRTQYQVPYGDILYFEGQKRKILLHTVGRVYDFYSKISQVMEDLDPQVFCRIHASFIVSMDVIRTVRENEICLRDGTQLPVSKAYRKEVREKHMNYMMRKSGCDG